MEVGGGGWRWVEGGGGWTVVDSTRLLSSDT